MMIKYDQVLNFRGRPNITHTSYPRVFLPWSGRPSEAARCRAWKDGSGPSRMASTMPQESLPCFNDSWGAVIEGGWCWECWNGIWTKLRKPAEAASIGDMSEISQSYDELIDHKKQQPMKFSLVYLTGNYGVNVGYVGLLKFNMGSFMYILITRRPHPQWFGPVVAQGNFHVNPRAP